MRKASLALALILGLAFPAVASAKSLHFEDDWNPSYNNDDSEHEDEGKTNPRPPKPSKETDYRHHEIEDSHEDDISGVIIPPIAIKPGKPADPNSYPLPNMDIDPLTGESTFFDHVGDKLAGIHDNQKFTTTRIGNQDVAKVSLNPVKTKPVQIKDVVLTTKTPTDEFMQNASSMGIGLGVVAFGLVTATSVHSIRLKRKIK